MTETEITTGLRAGDPAAFRALYQAHGRSVLTYLTRLMGRREVAEELTQETFLTAIRKIAFFKPGPGASLKAWIFRIGTHLAIDVLRREKRITLTEEAPDTGIADTPQTEFERFEFSSRLQDALSSLAPAQRMMFLLKEQEDMSCMEISRVCGCSENAVKQALFRARTALRTRLMSPVLEPVTEGSTP